MTWRRRRRNETVMAMVRQLLVRGPTTRQEMVEAVAADPVARKWQRTTIDRRVREALAVLVTESEYYAVATRRGYKLIETAAERDAAVRTLTRAAIEMLCRARKLDAAAVEAEGRQLGLEFAWSPLAEHPEVQEP